MRYISVRLEPNLVDTVYTSILPFAGNGLNEASDHQLMKGHAVISLRNTLLTGGVILAISIAAANAQPAQPPKSPTQLTPEQMVDEALRRYDVGEYQEALAYVQKAKSLKPDLSKLKLVQALLYLERRERKAAEAMSLLSDYVKSDEGKNDYRGHAALGKLYKESKMYRQALFPLEKAKLIAPVEQEGKPLRAMVTMDLAEAYFGMKNEKKAIATAKEAESLAPNDPGIQLELGRIASNTKDYVAAAKAAERALSLFDAKTRTDPFKMQDLKDMQECIDLKIKIYLSKLDADSKDANACADLATTLREKADIERRIYLVRAREYGIKGFANDPKRYKLQVFTARVEADLGGLQDAVDRLNDVINNDPDNQEAIKLRAEIQARMTTPPRS